MSLLVSGPGRCHALHAAHDRAAFRRDRLSHSTHHRAGSGCRQMSASPADGPRCRDGVRGDSSRAHPSLRTHRPPGDQRPMYPARRDGHGLLGRRGLARRGSEPYGADRLATGPSSGPLPDANSSGVGCRDICPRAAERRCCLTPGRHPNRAGDRNPTGQPGPRLEWCADLLIRRCPNGAPARFRRMPIRRDDVRWHGVGSDDCMDRRVPRTGSVPGHPCHASCPGHRSHPPCPSGWPAKGHETRDPSRSTCAWRSHQTRNHGTTNHGRTNPGAILPRGSETIHPGCGRAGGRSPRTWTVSCLTSVP